jgi:site-specific DNA-methyltransferase (adenine-specific)
MEIGANFELNSFYNIDCMELMKNTPDKFFELAIVDPPYGEECDINTEGNRTSARNGFSELYLKHTSGKWNIKPGKEYFDELFRVSKNQIIWGGNFFELPPTSCLIVWNKMQRNFTFGDGELAWASSGLGKSMRIFDFSRGQMQKETRIHITQKPVALYEWLLKNYAKEGDKILDTHAGSASSLIACHNLGFEYVGCEVDGDYFKAANERLEAHKAQMRLF